MIPAHLVQQLSPPGPVGLAAAADNGRKGGRPRKSTTPIQLKPVSFAVKASPTAAHRVA